MVKIYLGQRTQNMLRKVECRVLEGKNISKSENQWTYRAPFGKNLNIVRTEDGGFLVRLTKSLGSGLRSIKEKVGVISQTPSVKGERLYRAGVGSVRIFTMPDFGGHKIAINRGNLANLLESEGSFRYLNNRVTALYRNYSDNSVKKETYIEICNVAPDGNNIKSYTRRAVKSLREVFRKW